VADRSAVARKEEDLRVPGEEDEFQNAAPIRLLKVSEVADRTETSVSTVRREIRLRHLACYCIGRTVRVSEDQ
jgi:excisionase family DNA binding protein